MELIDTSLWIDFFRSSTPASVKVRIQPLLKRPDIVLCEPVVFETLRAAPLKQRSLIESVFETVPVLSTPPLLWQESCRLGQKCAESGFTPPSLDLLIAQIAIHHKVRLITFDRDFEHISKIAHTLQVQVLTR